MPTTLPFALDPDTTTTFVSRTDAGAKVAFLRIEYDRDAQNPCDDDGVGRIMVFERRTNVDEVNTLLTDPRNVLLAKYEHGNVRWFVDGLEKGIIPDRRWDCSEAAGLWIPDKYTDEACPISKADATRDSAQAAARRQWFREQAQSACESYTDYCNGQTFGYTLDIYDARLDEGGDVFTGIEDYHRATPTDTDSCWGYIGDDAITEAVADVLSSYSLTDARVAD